MELCGSSPAKARDEAPEKRHPIGTPLVAVHRAKSRRGDVTQRLEENEKLARVAPGAWDGSAQDAAREKSHAHLRRDSSSSGGRAHADATAGHCEEALASASRQVASDPGSASLPRLTASRSGGSAGPPVGRRPPYDHQATPVLPAGRRSRDPASSERAPLPGVSPPQSSAAVRSNKQGRRRPPAVRWTIEWTDEQIGPAVHQAADSPIETTTTTLSATVKLSVTVVATRRRIKFYCPATLAVIIDGNRCVSQC